MRSRVEHGYDLCRILVSSSVCIVTHDAVRFVVNDAIAAVVRSNPTTKGTGLQSTGCQCAEDVVIEDDIIEIVLEVGNVRNALTQCSVEKKPVGSVIALKVVRADRPRSRFHDVRYGAETDLLMLNANVRFVP